MTSTLTILRKRPATQTPSFSCSAALTIPAAGCGQRKNCGKWLTSAAANGSAEAQYQLGESLASDPEKAAEAFRWFRQAAEHYPLAARRTAECYEHGFGVDVSEVEAAKWYRKAAEAKDPVAQRRLARLLLNQSERTSHEEAVQWLKLAAAQNDAESQYWLGALYATGKGVKQNTSEMLNCYRKAAQNGYAPAQVVIGYMLETGSGVPKNDVEAVQWYQKAAEQGDMNALYNLGLK